MTPLAMSCGDDVLAGWLHPANGTVGVVIAVGGGQISCGPQRLFLTLANILSQAGHPVLRFDRRGIGDSTGDDPGYLESGPDIAAAVAALQAEAKGVTHVVGIGLCDAATALLLGSDIVDSIIAMNPWPFEAGETRSAAAERAHYRRRLLQPAAWRRLFSGRVNPLPALMSVVRRRAAPPTSLALRIERAVAATADRAT
ncbi:MAG: hydrolase 1, exosortase A system-associated, partial [Pseudomonadota bacterium]